MSPIVTDIDLTLASRRQLLAMAVVGGAGLFGASDAEAETPARARGSGKRTTLTVLGTTDLHGNVYNWNYFNNAPYSDSRGNEIGIAKAATLIKNMRAERGAHRCLTLDAGNTIQGTPLAYYFAKVDPITEGSRHPMATAMNAVGYDAAALGNHEFNYGLDTLREFQRQCHFPLVSANSVDWTTGRPVFRPYVLKCVRVPGSAPLTVGILGLVTPGVAIWDKANVDGKVRFPGIVEQAKKMVPRMKRAGADIVIVSDHSGSTTSSSYGDAIPYPENASRLLAEQVPDIDAVLVGHAHVEVPELTVRNEVTGREVLLSEPLYWGMPVSVMDFDLQKVYGRWTVRSSGSTLLNANTVPEDKRIARLVRPAHEKVLTHVNLVIGTSTGATSAATSRYEDSAAMDFTNLVQGEAVREALVGTPQEGLPVSSIAAPFNKRAAIPQGEVTVRDVAGLYIYDNTLLGVTAQRRAGEGLPRAVGDLRRTGCRRWTLHPRPGHERLERARPERHPGLQLRHHERDRRGTDLRHRHRRRAGRTHQDPRVCRGAPRRRCRVRHRDQQLPPVRRGQLSHVSTAPVVYNRQMDVRQLLIDWVTENAVIDPPVFASIDWRLVADGVPVQITA